MKKELLKNIIDNIEKWGCGNGFGHFPQSLSPIVDKYHETCISIDHIPTHTFCLEHGWPAVVIAASSVDEETWNDLEHREMYNLVTIAQCDIGCRYDTEQYFKLLSTYEGQQKLIAWLVDNHAQLDVE